MSHQLIKLVLIGSVLSAFHPVYGNDSTDECSNAFNILSQEMKTSVFFSEILSQEGLDTEINISEISEETKDKISEYATILTEMSKESSACSKDIRSHAQKLLGKLLKWQVVINAEPTCDEASCDPSNVVYVPQKAERSYLYPVIAVTAATITGFVAVGAYFLPSYRNGENPSSYISKVYFSLFKLLNFAIIGPQVVYVGGGGDGGSVLNVVQEIHHVADFSDPERITAMNWAARVFGYKGAFTHLGNSLSANFNGRNWEAIVKLGDKILVHGKDIVYMGNKLIRMSPDTFLDGINDFNDMQQICNGLQKLAIK